MTGLNLSLGRVEGNCCYDNCCVMSESEFTETELDMLYQGCEVEKDGFVLYLCDNE